jgi:hypothetical protein
MGRGTEKKSGKNPRRQDVGRDAGQDELGEVVNEKLVHEKLAVVILQILH